MNPDQKVRLQLGNMMIEIIMLQHQLEEAQKIIADLRAKMQPELQPEPS